MSVCFKRSSTSSLLYNNNIVCLRNYPFFFSTTVSINTSGQKRNICRVTSLCLLDFSASPLSLSLDTRDLVSKFALFPFTVLYSNPNTATATRNMQCNLYNIQMLKKKKKKTENESNNASNLHHNWPPVLISNSVKNMQNVSLSILTETHYSITQRKQIRRKLRQICRES